MMRAGSLVTAMGLATTIACGGAIATEETPIETVDVAPGSSGGQSGTPSTRPPAAPPQSGTTTFTTLPTDPDPATRVTIASKVSAGWVAVDDTHVYFASMSSIARLPKSGGDVEQLSSQSFIYSVSDLALSPTSIFFAKGMGLARMPKDGGAVSTLIPALKSYAGAIAADAAGFFAQTGELIIRGDEGVPYTTESVHGSALRNVTLDADWVYFRRPTPGHPESLVRSPRRGGPAGGYDVLVEEVSVQGFVAVDSQRVYFSRSVGTTASDTQIASVPKAPGGSVTVLATYPGGAGGGIVDDTWVYWTQHQRVYAMRKDGSSTTIGLGVDSGGRAPATDGTRVYWSGYDGSIYATAVPK